MHRILFVITLALLVLLKLPFAPVFFAFSHTDFPAQELEQRAFISTQGASGALYQRDRFIDRAARSIPS